jgi:hypothetical protein
MGCVRSGRVCSKLLNDVGTFDAYALTMTLAAQQGVEEPNAQNVD